MREAPDAGFKRIAVIGIGNELNGDDAAGVLVARALAQRLGNREREDSPAFLIIEGGLAPEAFTGPLRRFQPDLVILVDAAELGESPGTVRSYDWSAAQGMSATTHTLPPSVLAEFLMKELGCQVRLVGIQPEHLEFDKEMSEAVVKAVEKVVEDLSATGFLGNSP